MEKKRLEYNLLTRTTLTYDSTCDTPISETITLLKELKEAEYKPNTLVLILLILMGVYIVANVILFSIALRQKTESIFSIATITSMSITGLIVIASITEFAKTNYRSEPIFKFYESANDCVDSYMQVEEKLIKSLQ